MAIVNTNTHSPEDSLEQALKGVPDLKLRSKLVQSYLSLKRNYVEGRFEASGLDAGKFCEVALRVAQLQVLGSYVPLGKRIPNFADACRVLVTSPSAAAHESIREIIPRGLVFIYTLRNKRGIGHIGGDVDANRVDAITIVHSADWVMCEFVRLYHGLSLEEAQDLVDNLAQRKLPVIWEIAGKKRVLIAGLSASDQSLLLLYSVQDSAVLVEDLFSWVEYSNFSLFKSNLLKKLHARRLIEYDQVDGLVYLSPLGVSKVEDEMLQLL
jgi:hypothetical protein